ncbi:MAG: SCO family protein [Candidatus Thiodiazotropha sp. (ex Epidulcina cf. delphinae)]|nr:SCO family protein [Candidatus Thiodiazotropha sp. (ex Epidulcina cf. delphinae)]
MSRIRMSQTGLIFRLTLAVWLWPGALFAADAPDPFRVVVSVKPIHSIVAGLMLGADVPELLIDDNRSPYDFTPSPQQRQGLREADLLFWVGPELEAGLAETVRELAPGVEVIELLSHERVKILPSRHTPGQRDPYFWLDNRNVMIILDDMTRLLQDADPKRAHRYERNRQKVLARLARIDREYEYGYRGMKAGLGVQYHDTLQYFEQAYALKILDRVTGSPRRPVAAASLLKVRERIVSGEAVCLLSEKGLPAEHLSLLTQGSGVNHGILDSLGVGLAPGPDLYFRLMDHNTDEIKRCLNADMQAASAARALAEQDGSPVVDGIGGGRFLLTDHLGRLVSKETMRGKYAMVYFGYTFCPDICPTSMQVLFQAFDLMGDKADSFQPYFITIDPERDTIAVMRDYVQYFDERLIGVTGGREMIDRVARLFKAGFEKVVEAPDDPERYLMDHSAALYLLGPHGRFVSKFAHGISAEDLAQRLTALHRDDDLR